MWLFFVQTAREPPFRTIRSHVTSISSLGSGSPRVGRLGGMQAPGTNGAGGRLPSWRWPEHSRSQLQPRRPGSCCKTPPAGPTCTSEFTDDPVPARGLIGKNQIN